MQTFNIRLEEWSMDNNMVSEIWVGMSTTYIHLLWFKIQSYLQNADFECRYIRIYTDEKPSKISNITFVILPFSHKNTLN